MARQETLIETAHRIRGEAVTTRFQRRQADHEKNLLEIEALLGKIQEHIDSQREIQTSLVTERTTANVVARLRELERWMA